MSFQAKSPEDMLPENKNTFEKNGKTIRKGTMAAAVTNAEIVESDLASEKEKLAAMEALKKLAPTLNAFGLNKHFYWRNPEIQAVFDEAKNA